SVFPYIHYLSVSLIVREKSVFIKLFHLAHFLVGVFEDTFLFGRYMHIEYTCRQCADGTVFIPENLYIVKHGSRPACAFFLEAHIDYLAQIALPYKKFNFVLDRAFGSCSLFFAYESEILRN